MADVVSSPTSTSVWAWSTSVRAAPTATSTDDRIPVACSRNRSPATLRRTDRVDRSNSVQPR
jgi:hypothetical protein